MATVAELKVAISASDSASGVIKGLGSSLNGLEKTALGVGNALGTGLKIAGAAAAAGGVAIAAGLGAAVSSAAGFEERLSAIGAVSGATGAEMSQFSALALQLGKDTAFSASEAASGIEELVKGGVSIQDVLGGGAKSALDLAAAGGVGLADAAKIAATALGQFSLKGNDLTNVADKIAGAANASRIGVSDFAQSMAAGGAVAAQVGVSFDDFAVAIAEMGRAGIQGSDAGTSLKTMLLNLSPSTDKAAGVMRELGIITADGANKFFDAQGNVRSFAQVQQVLADATENLTAEQKTNALQTIFGTDAIRAALVASKNGAAGFNELADAMSKVTASDVGAKRLDNLKGSIEQLKGSLETAAITAGIAFTPAIRKLVDLTTATINSAMPQIEAFAAQVPAAFDAIATGLNRPIQVLQDTFGTIQQVFAGDWAPDPSQIDPFTERVGELALVLRDQVIPAVLATAEWLGNSIPPAVASAQAAFASISETVGPIFADLKATVDDIASIFRDQLPPAAQSATSEINILSGAFGLLAGAVKILLTPLTLTTGAWRTYAETAAAASTANQQILATLGTAFNAAADVAIAALARISTAFQTGGLAGGLSGISTELASGLTALADVVGPALAPVGEAIGAFFSDLGTQAQAAVQAIGDAFSALGSTVEAAISTAGGTIISAWESAVDEPTRTLLADLVVAVGDLFGAMGDLTAAKMAQLAAAVDAGWAETTAATNSALAAITAAVDAGWAAVTAAVDAAMATILAVVTPGWTEVQSATETSNAAIQAAVDTAWNALNGIISAAMASVSGTVTGAWNEIVSNIEGILSGLAGSASSFGSGMVEAFAAGIRSRLQGALDAVRQMTSEIRSLLPGSDAEKGPLSDLTASGKALPETLAKGVLAGAPDLTAAFRRVFPATAKAAITGLSGDLTAEFRRQFPPITPPAASAISNNLTAEFNRQFPKTAQAAVSSLSNDLTSEFNKQFPKAATTGAAGLSNDLTSTFQQMFPATAKATVGGLSNDLTAEFNKQFPKAAQTAGTTLSNDLTATFRQQFPQAVADVSSGLSNDLTSVFNSLFPKGGAAGVAATPIPDGSPLAIVTDPASATAAAGLAAAVGQVAQQTGGLTSEQQAATDALRQYLDSSGALDGVSGQLGGVAGGWRSTADATNEARKALEKYIDALKDMPDGGGTEGRAHGGMVTAGTTYMVGEQGPELFRPLVSGNITPNNQLGSGGTTIVVNGDVYGYDDFASKVGGVITTVAAKQSRERSRNLR